MKLTINQQKFADEYIRTGNTTLSYLSAYQNVKHENSAAASGYRLLRNAKVKSFIDERLAELKKESIAEQDEILQYLTSVGRGEAKEPLMILSGGGKQEMIQVKPSIQARIKAYELLGKRYAMWTDRHQIEGFLGVTIIDDVSDDYED